MKTREMKSTDNINSVIGFLVETTGQIDKQGLNNAKFIMKSSNCEFVKRVQLAENKRVVRDTKRLIYLS